MRSMLLFLSLGLLACTPSSPRKRPADNAPEVDDLLAQADAEDPLTDDARPAIDLGTRAGPLRITPRKTEEGLLPHEPGSMPSDPTMGSHALTFGWDPTGQRFVLCFDNCGDYPFCSMYPVDEDTPIFEASEVYDPLLWLDQLGFTVGPTHWAHGADIELTWAEAGPQSVAFGAKLADDLGGDLLPRQIVLDFSDSDYFEPEDLILPHAEAISLSADGTMLALVVHAQWGHQSEYRVALISTQEFAAEAYNSAGLRHLRADAPRAAAGLFERAASVAPKQWKYPYNLACARARAGASKVEEALARAIELGGTTVVKKALRDRDFDSVRKRPAFVELLADGASK